MEPKLDLSGITIGGEDDYMGGYEFATSPTKPVTLSSLNYGHNYPNPNTITGGGYVSQGYGAVSNVSINGPVYTTSGSLGPFTIGSTGSNTSPWVYNPNPSSKIKLDGADADIEINGISLLTTMQEIQIRLNLLQPNTYLEVEWEELYALGRKYRELEQQIKDKQATWDRLKAMPPPVID
jgi:hypothetical protein